jgi:hypothetical protein
LRRSNDLRVASSLYDIRKKGVAEPVGVECTNKKEEEGKNI